MQKGIGVAVQCEDVARTFERGPIHVDALKGISFEVISGLFVAIRGPSGSGKSTLLNIVGCLDRATSGRTRLAGVDVSRASAIQAGRVRRSLIGFVLQELALLEHLTALENVMLPLVFDGDSSAKSKALAEDALGLAGVSHKAAQFPRELSAGERQRVAIARSVVRVPRILLADEPTASLDTANADNIASVFLQLASKGTTIIAATHDDRLSRHADRVIWLVDGRIERRDDRSLEG